jgi:acyl carrier protein
VTDWADTINAEGIIVDSLRERGALEGIAESEQWDHDYLASGALDSMAIVEFVTELEERLEVRFQSDDLLSPEFHTVGGLVRMSNRLRA